jgi:hypothetical protein
VFDFAQTPRRQREEAPPKEWGAGNGELLMNDAQRYRANAAECLSAAERCGPSYRGLTLEIAASWLALARHQETMDELVGDGGNRYAAAAPPHHREAISA